MRSIPLFVYVPFQIAPLCIDNVLPFCFGVLDLRTGEFVYVNAGHNPPLVLRGGQEPCYLMPEGKPDKPLGVMEGRAYQQCSMTLTSGDMIFLYTDGVTEAINETEELYGEERFYFI